jgi:hypothetical protein
MAMMLIGSEPLFASTDDLRASSKVHKITIDDQVAKLRLVVDTAIKFWEQFEFRSYMARLAHRPTPLPI